MELPADLRDRIAKTRAQLQTMDRDRAAYALQRLTGPHAGHPEVAALRARLLFIVGDERKGLEVLKSARAAHPAAEAPALDLARYLWTCNHQDHAIRELEKFLESQPRSRRVLSLLEWFLSTSGQQARAARIGLRIAELDPEHPDSWQILGEWSQVCRRYDQAIGFLRRGMERYPRMPSWASLTFMTLLYGNADPGLVRAETERWVAAATSDVPLLPPPPPRPPGTRLRIGYIGSCFRFHVVAYFLMPLLRNHDRSRVHLIAYDEKLTNDEGAELLLRCFDETRPIQGQTDVAIAEQVRADDVDVLVDLAGHTESNFLRVFARRPARVHVTYLGYPATTGLPRMDYRLTDAIADPVGQTDAYCTERLYRLPRCAWAYAPLEDELEATGDLVPAPRSGPLVLGAFNLLTKIDPATASLWGKALAAAGPQVRLILTDRRGLLDDAEAAEQLYRELTAAGATRDQIRFEPYLRGWRQHRARYDLVDLLLDPLGYNGTTTTCEATWNGVPVLTLPGRSHVSRVSASLLTAAGLERFIARDEADFIDRVRALALDPAPLRSLRPGLRQQMRTSALCDGAALARAVEDAYFDMLQTAQASPRAS